MKTVGVCFQKVNATLVFIYLFPFFRSIFFHRLIFFFLVNCVNFAWIDFAFEFVQKWKIKVRKSNFNVYRITNWNLLQNISSFFLLHLNVHAIEFNTICGKLNVKKKNQVSFCCYFLIVKWWSEMNRKRIKKKE